MIFFILFYVFVVGYLKKGWGDSGDGKFGLVVFCEFIVGIPVV